ncbi:glycerate kinase [Corticibacter populi]|uniref:Glycerate kinase n=1 Tax=Corticibacter populi TaxID=1550736 RepID=A0A3M6QML0_9BURK|nr:glycerate kinase [Corticibacter populi]RMX04328.1 glycerate kinase [Corticibacter populi]
MHSGLKSVLIVAVITLVLTTGYVNQGWTGFFAVFGVVVFFFLLHFTKVMRVLRIAANTPKGVISSAVMLNARLRPGMSMLQVVQQTRSLSVPQSPLDVQPEIHRWTDLGGAWVDCQFVNGKLVVWSLGRPETEAEAP